MPLHLCAGDHPEMSTSRNEREQVLAVKKRLEEMLVSIVNLPDEEFPVTANPDEKTEISIAAYRAYRESGQQIPWQYQKIYDPSPRPRAITEEWWPELWKEIPGQNIDADERGRQVLKKMRDYLRRFWEANTPRERDWHMYRAREYYERLRILPQVLESGIQSE